MTTTTTAAGGVMARLRAETWDHHARAEGKALQRDLVRGELPRAMYAAWLGQMYLVHRALEAAVERSRGSAAVLSVVSEEQRHSVRLAEDLTWCGVEAGGVEPIGATRGLTARIDAVARENPAAVLGLAYVLEGSMNGNAFIARAVRKAYAVSGSEGVRYLESYGEQQRPKWAAWKAAVDAHAWSAADADAAVDAAKVMFEGVGAISEELGAPR